MKTNPKALDLYSKVFFEKTYTLPQFAFQESLNDVNLSKLFMGWIAKASKRALDKWISSFFPTFQITEGMAQCRNIR